MPNPIQRIDRPGSAERRFVCGCRRCRRHPANLLGSPGRVEPAVPVGPPGPWSQLERLEVSCLLSLSLSSSATIRPECGLRLETYDGAGVETSTQKCVGSRGWVAFGASAPPTNGGASAATWPGPDRAGPTAQVLRLNV